MSSLSDGQTVCRKKKNRRSKLLLSFSQELLRPYGKVDAPPSDDTIFTRINPSSCEWLCPPAVAASEFAATVSENLEIVQESPLLKETEVEGILPHLKKLRDLSQPLSKDSAEPASKKK